MSTFVSLYLFIYFSHITNYRAGSSGKFIPNLYVCVVDMQRERMLRVLRVQSPRESAGQ